MSSVFLFSLTAMANPTLLAATTVMLILPQPKRLMLGYLLGALLTSVTIGLVIVLWLNDVSAVSTAKNTVNPIVDLALGALLIVIALVLASERTERYAQGRRERKAARPVKEPPLWQRQISKGSARTTFAVGVVLTLPGASYLAALVRIDKLDPGTVQSVALVLMVNVIMLALLEIPLIGFVVAPEQTSGAVAGVKAWFARNARRIVVTGAAGLGALLIVRGLVTLLS